MVVKAQCQSSAFTSAVIRDRGLICTIRFTLLAETWVIAGIALSTYLVGQALSGAMAVELWPWA